MKMLVSVSTMDISCPCVDRECTHTTVKYNTYWQKAILSGRGPCIIQLLQKV